GACAPEVARGNDSEADATSPKDGHDIVLCHAATGGRVEADGQRFHHAERLQAELRWIELLLGHYDELGHGTITLDSEGLVELAGVRTAAAAGGALAAARIWRHRDVHAGSQFWVAVAALDDGCGNLVAGNARKRNERVLAAERVEIAAAEPDQPDSEE